MIRQLTADEQHDLERVVQLVLDGLWIASSPVTWETKYILNKAVLVAEKRAEPVEEDNTWERHWAQEGLPRAPFNSDWDDMPRDIRTVQYLEDIGSKGINEPKDTLAEGTADRLDFGRNIKRRLRRQHERTE